MLTNNEEYRTRTYYKDNEWLQIFEGKNGNYVGDIKWGTLTNDYLFLQIHKIKLKNHNFNNMEFVYFLTFIMNKKHVVKLNSTNFNIYRIEQ